MHSLLIEDVASWLAVEIHWGRIFWWSPILGNIFSAGSLATEMHSISQIVHHVRVREIFPSLAVSLYHTVPWHWVRSLMSKFTDSLEMCRKKQLTLEVAILML
jgi:hypothetical protein